THRHLLYAPLRFLQPDALLADYLRDMGQAVARYRPEDCRIGARAGALRSLHSGVTTLVDISQGNTSPEHSDALIAGLKESHVRGFFAYAPPRRAEANLAADLARIREQHFSERNSLVDLALAPALDAEQWRLGRRFGARLFPHV